MFTFTQTPLGTNLSSENITFIPTTISKFTTTLQSAKTGKSLEDESTMFQSTTVTESSTKSSTFLFDSTTSKELLTSKANPITVSKSSTLISSTFTSIQGETNDFTEEPDNYTYSTPGYKMTARHSTAMPSTEQLSTTSSEQLTTSSANCPHGDGYFPNLNNCTSYILCYNGQASNKFCPDGLFYNPSKRTCDTISECDTNISNPTSRNLQVDCDCDHCVLPDADDCSKYYLCIDGVAYDETCSDGLLFNAEVLTCDYAEKVTCAEPSPQCEEMKNGNASFAEDCSRYYHCIGGIAHEKQCKGEMHFNEETQQCEAPCEAGCDMSLDCVISSPSSVCVEPDGFFPNPEDCSTFYQCIGGVPILSLCIDEHFSPINFICQDPCEAMCDLTIDCPDGRRISSEITSKPSNITERFTTPTEFFSSTISYTTITDEPSTVTMEETSETLQPPSTVEQIVTNENNFSTISPYSLFTDSPEPLTSTEIPGFNLLSTTTDLPFSTEIPTSTSGYTLSTGLTKSDDKDPTTIIALTTSSAQPSLCEDSARPYPKQGDCKRFYMCMGAKPLEFHCPGELHFSPVMRICEDACQAKCDPTLDCSSTEKPQTLMPFAACRIRDFLPKDGFCNYYINCTSGIPEKRICPPGLSFNPTKRVCDIPRLSGCDKPPRKLPFPDFAYDCPCENCMIASKRSCSVYYLCLEKIAYPMQCSRGLLFDKELNTCNYAHRVRCFPPAKPTTRPSPVTKQTIPPKSFKCPHPNGMFRNQNNCRKYIHCSNWHPFDRDCPGELHFSIERQRCDWPCEAKCNMSLSCYTTSKPTPLTYSLCPCRNCEVPSPESCHKFLECRNGVPTSKYCPHGQFFDKKKSQCDWAHRVECEHTVQCPRRNGYFPYKEDCHSFIQCTNGIPIIRTCPADLKFDPIRLRCTYADENCASPHPREKGKINLPDIKKWKCPSSFGYFRHEENCSKFYQCSHGTPFLQQCPNGLMYNSRYQTCDWPKNVNCDKDEYHLKRRCRRYDKDVQCPLNGTNLIHAHCDMFYDCTTGKACPKRCPDGLFFNVESHVCDHPGNVSCRKRDGYSYNLRDFSESCRQKRVRPMRDPANESCFYRCSRMKVVRGCCSRNRIFDERRDSCEPRKGSYYNYHH